MSCKIIRNHIFSRVFIIPILLILTISLVSTDIDLSRRTAISEGNSGMACCRGADIDIRTHLSLDRVIYIPDALYYRVNPAQAFLTRCSENIPSIITVSKGTSINGIFKKLKRMLSGISKFF
jgi:hypothetical protein